MVTPLHIYNKLKWEIQAKKNLNENIDIFRKLLKFPNRQVPQRIKDEITAIILMKYGDLLKAYKMFKKAYQTYGRNDDFILLAMTDLSHGLGYKEEFLKFDRLVRETYGRKFKGTQLVGLTDVMSDTGVKNYLSLHEADHDKARLLATVLNEKIAKVNGLSVDYLFQDITEAAVVKIDGPVLTYNNLIIKDKSLLILGTNKDEVTIKDTALKLDVPPVEIEGDTNFYYCNAVYENHYHMLIEHIPVYNFVANRFPDWTYYKITTNISTLEGEFENFSPIVKDTLYLHKNGFYTMALPRTKVPELFDTYRPPDLILQEYRALMLETFKQDKTASRPIVYMPRQVNRELEGDNYLIDRLKKEYPELIVFTGKETEQNPIFTNAKMILGPHGAGFSNMLYCPSDCIIYEIGLKVPDNFFGSLSRTFNLPYFKDENVKIGYYGKSYPTKADYDSIFLQVQRLLLHGVAH